MNQVSLMTERALARVNLGVYVSMTRTSTVDEEGGIFSAGAAVGCRASRVSAIAV